MLKLLFLLILWIPRRILSYVKQIWSRNRYPPGPFPLPVVGSLWRLLGTGYSERTFRKLAKHYGNVYSLWAGSFHIIIFSGYQAVKEALIETSEVFVHRPVSPFISDITKNRGIVFSNGHTWKQQRRFGVVTMRKLGLGKSGMESQIQEEAQQLVEFFADKKGQPFDPSLPITKSVCNVICAQAFGHRFSVEDKDFVKLMEASFNILKFQTSIYYVLYEGFPQIMKHLPGPHQTISPSAEMILSFVKKEIKQHKENPSLHEPQDLTDFYLLQMEKSKDDPNSTYDEDNLTHCVFDLLIAGTDTTSASLQWALLLMATHLDIQGEGMRPNNITLIWKTVCAWSRREMKPIETLKSVPKEPVTKIIYHLWIACDSNGLLEGGVTNPAFDILLVRAISSDLALLPCYH